MIPQIEVENEAYRDIQDLLLEEMKVELGENRLILTLRSFILVGQKHYIFLLGGHNIEICDGCIPIYIYLGFWNECSFRTSYEIAIQQWKSNQNCCLK